LVSLKRNFEQADISTNTKEVTSFVQEKRGRCHGSYIHCSICRSLGPQSILHPMERHSSRMIQSFLTMLAVHCKLARTLLQAVGINVKPKQRWVSGKSDEPMNFKCPELGPLNALIATTNYVTFAKLTSPFDCTFHLKLAQ